MLSTLNILNWLDKEPDFIGVFPINKLPSCEIPMIPREVKFVVNTDSDNLGGMHWLAVYRRHNGHAEIFDSFALMPPSEIMIWCSKHCKSWINNTLCIQKPTSTMCGIYCCLYLSSRAKFKSLNDCVIYLSKIV